MSSSIIYGHCLTLSSNSKANLMGGLNCNLGSFLEDKGKHEPNQLSLVPLEKQPPRGGRFRRAE